MQKAQGQRAASPVTAPPPRTAVVLAAGCSQRLSPLTAGGSKLLLRLGGLALIERAVRFGKDVDSSWADCGAFLVPPAIFECQRQAAADGDHGLGGAISRLARVCPLRAVPLPEEAWWQDVDTPADVQRATARLRRS